MIPQLPTPRPGRQLSAKALTQVFDQAAGFRVSVDQPPVDQLPYSWRGFRRFPARLTRESDNADGSYDWTEQLAAEDGTWADLPAGRGGTSYASAGPDTLNPAWEDNLTSGIAADPDTGTVVWMEEGWLDDSGGGTDLDYRFSLAGGGGGGGGGDFPDGIFSGVLAYCPDGTPISIPASTSTEIEWTNVAPAGWNTDVGAGGYIGVPSTDLVGPLVPGWYIFEANLQWGAGGGATRAAWIEVNGNTIRRVSQSVPLAGAAAQQIGQSLSGIVALGEGATLNLWVYQDDVAPVNLDSGGLCDFCCSLSLTRLGVTAHS